MSSDDRFTVGELIPNVGIHNKDEVAEKVASFVRAALDVVRPEFPESTVGIKWGKYFVFVAVSYAGDVVNEPSHGHPTLRA